HPTVGHHSETSSTCSPSEVLQKRHARSIQYLELEEPPGRNASLIGLSLNQIMKDSRFLQMVPKTGSAFVVYQDGEEISHVSVRLNDEATVCLAELSAIHLAVNYVLDHSITNAEIISDSRVRKEEMIE
ncbi:hypothetical protein CDAR_405671, partial [Caerostris darwini]